MYCEIVVKSRLFFIYMRFNNFGLNRSIMCHSLLDETINDDKSGDSGGEKERLRLSSQITEEELPEMRH